MSKMSSLTLHPFTPVRSVTYQDDDHKYPYTVVTDRGKLRACTVVHATNAYASYLLPPAQGLEGVFGCKCHVMAVRPDVSGGPELRQGFGWDNMWHWTIQRPDNGPFIYGYSASEIIGDYDDSTTLPENHEARASMYNWLHRFFPQHFSDEVHDKDVLYDWTGIQGYTMNGASMVGRPYADRKGEFMSVGHNGEGMTRCVSSSTVLTEAILAYLDGDSEWKPPEWFPKAFRRNI